MLGPVVRILKGHFSAENYTEVKRLIEHSAVHMVPPLKALRGLIYYHAGVDASTNTIVNVSIWHDLEAAKQMDTLHVMLAVRPVLEAAGVTFDKIANYEPLWMIGTIHLE
jgi:hypothetical protein